MPAWRPPDGWSYALLLGFYLGDGCLTTQPRTTGLRIACDVAYPEIVEDCRMAVQLTAPDARVTLVPRTGAECLYVSAYWSRWLQALPQHSPGRKHLRHIALESWQTSIVEEHPWPFLRGLLHSDGCRSVNRFKTRLPSGRIAEYAYPRWFFSNESADIRAIFCATCDHLGLQWTQSSRRNVSIAKRASVALLDEHVGPKA